jgi:hypothetical protein
MFLAFCSFHLFGVGLLDMHMLFDIDFLHLGRLFIHDLSLAFFDLWYNIEESLYPTSPPGSQPERSR